MPSVKQALLAGARQLQQAQKLPADTDCNLEAGILLAHVLKKSRSWLYAWPEHPLEPIQQQDFSRLLQRRCNGEPISYITGNREFWGLPVAVTPDTLIPRPETELLVETALQLVTCEAANVLELGTGSGAIALALAREKPHWKILATEKNPATLRIARKNFEQHAKAVNTLASNWFEAVTPGQYDLIISNPPYIEADDPHLQQGDLRFEPRAALASGIDGLDDIRQITAACMSFLKTNGILMLEHGYNQAEAVRQLFDQAGLKQIRTLKDHAGHDRLTLARRL